MEKKLQLFIATSLICILLSILPLYEAFDIYKNKSNAQQQYIVSSLTIDPKNIDEVVAKDVDVSNVSVTHEFTSGDGKSKLVHQLKDYETALKKNQTYKRIVEYENQKIEILVDLKKQVVKSVTVDHKVTHPNIKINLSLNGMFKHTKWLFEKGRISGNAAVIMLHEQSDHYNTYLLANHQQSQVFVQNKAAIKHNGVWLNRLIEADFSLLKTQKIAHFMFYGFIFYPILTLIFGLFLMYICVLRIQYLIQHQKLKWFK